MIEDMDFPSVNRALMTVEMKQPFIDWVNSIREDRELKSGIVYELEGLNAEPTAYLIPEVFDPTDFELFLERYWIMLFEMQLSGWVLEEKLWPKKRTRQLFDEWFTIKCSSLVIDLWDKEPLQYQE